jgi:hypothetical protein
VVESVGETARETVQVEEEEEEEEEVEATGPIDPLPPAGKSSGAWLMHPLVARPHPLPPSRAALSNPMGDAASASRMRE